MKLHGTRTSPYVRRVRIVARILGASIDLSDTLDAEGQTALRRASPIWKVPVLETEEGPLYDSRVIIDYLIERFGGAELWQPAASERWSFANHISVIDGAVDAAINVFYLRRDGAEPKAIPYLQKQIDRASSAMGWIDTELGAGKLGQRLSPVGLAEIALVTSIDWMRFRNAYPVERHPAIVAFSERSASVPSFQSTLPED